MPGAFRLSFAQPRLGHSIKVLDKVSERSESTSSTEYEKITPPPLQTVVEPDEFLQPASVVPADIPGEGTLPSSGLGEFERKFALEEKYQSTGETRRMEAFNDFLQAVTVTFQRNEQDRSQKLLALLDSQKAEFASHENDRQTLFSKDLERFERAAKENQSRCDADRVFYETTRESLMKAGRERRALLKDEAIRELEKFALETCELERKQFEKETQRMDGVVGELIQKAEHDIDTMALGTSNAKSDSIHVLRMKDRASVYENRKSIAPVIMNAPAPTNQGLSLEQDSSELSYYSPQPLIPPQPPIPPQAPIPPPPPSVPYKQPVFPPAQVTSPNRGRPLPLPPGCRSPGVMDSFTSQPRPLIAPSTLDPKTHTYPLATTTMKPTVTTQPFIFQPSPRRLPEPQSLSQGSSSDDEEEEVNMRRTLPVVPSAGPLPSPPKDSIGFAVDLRWENGRHAEEITPAGTQQLNLEDVEATRDEGEEKRQEIFDSALRTMQETFSLTLSGFSERSTFLEVRRGGEEQSRDQEFDSLLKLLRARFESFKAGIEKRYGVLDVLEADFNEELKAGIVQSSLKQEKELNDAREKIRASFAELQLGRREQLRVVLDELTRMKNDAKVRSRKRPALHALNTSTDLLASTDGRKDTDDDFTCVYYRGPPLMEDAGVGSSRIPPAQTGLLGAHEPATRYSRARTPPTGFAPQSLFRLQSFGSLPAPRPPIVELPKGASTPPAEQPPASTSNVQKPEAAATREDPSKLEFMVNESRRSIAFDKAQAERQQDFYTAERERDLEVAKTIWERDQKFMDAELQWDSDYLEKSQLRSRKFVQEQEKMRSEYYETEERLVRKCMIQTKARDESIREIGKGKIEWWKEDVRREETERRWEFEEMVKWFMERGGYQTSTT